MPDLIISIPNHGYTENKLVSVSWLEGNYYVRSKSFNSFKISSTANDLNLVQFTSTVTDGFVREITEGATTTITGLEHLEGEVVSVTADGVVVGSYTVVSGAITTISNVFTYAVGKSYEATLIPMDLDIEGTGLATTKRPNRVIINLHETIGGKIGQDVSSLVSIPDVDTLTTDFREISLPGGYTRDTDVVVKQTSPLPMTVLSLTYDLGASRD